MQKEFCPLCFCCSWIRDLYALFYLVFLTQIHFFPSLHYHYRDISVPSEAVDFADDGPLADPALFGGYWMPWRDEMGVPYATYATSDQFAGKLDPKTGKPTDKMNTDNGSRSVDGSSDGSGDKTWKASKDLSAGQRGEGNAGGSLDQETLLVRSAAAASETSTSSSSESTPAFLVSGGAILGALGAVVVQAVLSRNAAPSPSSKRESSYAAVRTEEA